MVFVDGENFAVRFGAEIEDNAPQSHVQYRKDVYVWSSALAYALNKYEVVRKYYFTALRGDTDAIHAVENELRNAEIEAPRVFKRTKARSSKRVDIALATEFLMHAYRDNFDVAVLVSGDEDFVPVVDAVASLGKRVIMWSLSSGRSKLLASACDYSIDISPIMWAPTDFAYRLTQA